MLVVMFPDFHGVKESVDWQIDQLQMYQWKPEKTIVLHEPLPSSRYLRGYSDIDKTSGMTLDFLWENIQLEDCWGPSEQYRGFYRFLMDGGYSLAPLDIEHSERMDLARGFMNVATRAMGAKTSASKGSSADICKDFDLLKGRLCFEREEYFARHINGVRYGNVETAVAVMHPSHINSVAGFLKDTQGLEVKIVEMNPTHARQLEAEENRIQGEAAKKVLEEKDMEKAPPFVPAVIAAFAEAAPLYRQFERPALVA